VTPTEARRLDHLETAAAARAADAARAAVEAEELAVLRRQREDAAEVERDRRKEAARLAEVERLRNLSIPHQSGGSLGINLIDGRPDSFNTWAGRCPCGCVVVVATTQAAAESALAGYLEKNPSVRFREPAPSAETPAENRNRKKVA